MLVMFVMCVFFVCGVLMIVNVFESGWESVMLFWWVIIVLCNFSENCWKLVLVFILLFILVSELWYIVFVFLLVCVFLLFVLWLMLRLYEKLLLCLSEFDRFVDVCVDFCVLWLKLSDSIVGCLELSGMVIFVYNNVFECFYVLCWCVVEMLYVRWWKLLLYLIVKLMFDLLWF